MKKTKKTFVFVVDTDSYSGNFEREMCALLTGAEYEFYHDWDKRVAEQTRNAYQEHYFFIVNHMLYEPDPESNARHPRPCFLIPTPGWWNDGNGKQTKGTPPEGSYPAYQSVGLKFDARPPLALIKHFKSQAMTFNSVYKDAYLDHKDIKIIGFRLLEETTTVKTVSKKI